MPRPQVAIIGSVDESRTFDPPLTDSAAARSAAEQIGRALATAGWDIVVYSAKPTFIECDVVRGYVASAKATTGSIHVRTPSGKGAFAESTEHRDLFTVWTDASSDWEVSYYRSLTQCQGVVLIGGGRSTFIAGIIALTAGIPIFPLSFFGGNARKVWAQMAAGQNSLSEQDIAMMAEDWRADSAPRAVECLARQLASRQALLREVERGARRQRRFSAAGAVATVALLLAMIAGLTLAWTSMQTTGSSVAILAALPTLGGAAGALVRTSLDNGNRRARAAVLGAAAGFVTGLLYIASQLIGAPDVLQADPVAGTRRLLFFVLPIGFVAGLTLDAVYERWRASDVSQAGGIERLTAGADRR